MAQRTGNPLLDREEDEDPFAGTPEDGGELELAGIPSAKDVSADSIDQNSPLPPLGPKPGSGGPGPASKRLQEILGQGEGVYSRKKPNMWERLGAIGVGAAAGWNNANPKATQVDASQTIQNILYPGQKRREGDYERRVGLAKVGAAEEENQTRIGALAEQRKAQAGDYAERERQRADATAQRAQAVKDKIAELQSTRNRTFLANRLKGREGDSTYQSKDAPLPLGYEFIEDTEHPGFGFAAPPVTRSAPEELLPYLPGVKVGETISHSEFVKARDSLIKQKGEDKKAENRPDRIPTNEYQGLLKQFTDADGNIDYAAANKANEAAQIRRSTAGRAVINAAQLTPAQVATLHNPPVSGGRNEEFLKTLSPQDQAYIQLLADYKADAPKGIALKDPAVRNLIANAKLYDPDFDEKEYPVRSKVAQDYASAKRGTTGGNIVSLNTLTGHIATLHEMAVALGNKDMNTYNRLANALSKEFGNPQVTNFDLAKAAVATELSTALKGQATEGDIKTWADNLSAAGSPEQLRGAITVPLHLMHTRFSELQNKYQDVMHKPFLMISPASAKAFKQFGLDAGAVDPRYDTGPIPQTPNLGNPSIPASGKQGANPNPSGYVQGHIYGGLTYLGGDPNSATSWRK